VGEQAVGVAFNDGQTRAAFRLYNPKGNSITLEMVHALSGGLESIAANPHLRLITLEGAGADFSFGANIPEHEPATIGRVLPAMHQLIADLLEAPAPTAAVVRGRCLGGGFELALACDFIFASEDAAFGLPEIDLGVFPPAAAALLPWRIGGARATRTIVTGEARTAREWHGTGLLTLVAPASDLDRSVDEWFARHLAPRSASALRYAAAAARTALVAHVESCLPRLERLYLEDVMRTADAAEGIAAFLEKRAPRWADR
jgi:cyclohexa-1,5-dienecarbonyl-CoA hydratase